MKAYLAPIDRPGICGTYAGANRHTSLRERKCEPCKAAAAEYKRLHRAKGGNARERERAEQMVRDRATTLLIERHRAEFDAIRAELRPRVAAERGGGGERGDTHRV